MLQNVGLIIYNNRNMIVLSGASASGKTEVAKMLAAKYNIVKVITTTTRPMRINEINGKDYFFVTVEEFHKMEKEGRFVETTQYNGNFYGSTKDQIADSKCIVVDLAGLKKYIELGDNRVITFFLESKEETRHKRMLSRGDDPEIAKKRIDHDRIAFSKENIPVVDFYIESEVSDVETVCDTIYNIYTKR